MYLILDNLKVYIPEELLFLVRPSMIWTAQTLAWSFVVIEPIWCVISWGMPPREYMKHRIMSTKWKDHGPAPFDSLFSECHPVTVLLPHHFFAFALIVVLEHLASSSTQQPVTGI